MLPFVRKEIHVNLSFVPLPPKVTVGRDHIYTSSTLRNRGCSLNRLCIFCSFFPLKASYQNLPVVFLSSYPKNMIRSEAVNTPIGMLSVSSIMLFPAPFEAQVSVGIYNSSATKLF